MDFFSVEDGGECNGDGDSELVGSFVCKEGSGCIYSNTSSTKYKCMKITTKIEDAIPCTDEDDTSCPDDSSCYCNSVTGKMQCVPYIACKKEGVEYYKKYMEIEDHMSEEALAYAAALINMYYSYDEDIHCATPYPLPGSSSDRKPLAFSLVLFLIGLIKAFF